MSRKHFMDDEELARMTAAILGQASAAARALEELERRRAAGEDVRIIDFQNRWLVGPTPGSAISTKEPK